MGKVVERDIKGIYSGITGPSCRVNVRFKKYCICNSDATRKKIWQRKPFLHRASLYNEIFMLRCTSGTVLESIEMLTKNCMYSAHLM